MAYLLVVDASTTVCSVAIRNEQQTFSLIESQPRRQAQLLLPMVDTLLTQANISKTQLDGIAYGRGPGSFTGIRIAASVMQGIALALSLPVCGISSLQAIAQAVFRQSDVHQVMAIMDAHMGEVFWGCFERSGDICVSLGAEKVGTPEQCLADISHFNGVLAGDGLALPALVHLNQTWQSIQPEAINMLPLVEHAWQTQQFSDPEKHQPVYLRESVAWKKLDEQPSLLRRS